jgi:hypothetical protein
MQALQKLSLHGAEGASVGCGPDSETPTVFCSTARTAADFELWLRLINGLYQEARRSGNEVVKAHFAIGEPPSPEMCARLVEFAASTGHGYTPKLVCSPAAVGLLRMASVGRAGLQLSTALELGEPTSHDERTAAVRSVVDALERTADFEPLLPPDAPLAPVLNALARGLRKQARDEAALLAEDFRRLEAPLPPGLPPQARSDASPFDGAAELRRRLRVASGRAAVLAAYKFAWIVLAEELEPWATAQLRSLAPNVPEAPSDLYTRAFPRAEGATLMLALLESVRSRPAAATLEDLAAQIANGDSGALLAARVQPLVGAIDHFFQFSERSLLPYLAHARPAFSVDCPIHRRLRDPYWRLRRLFLTGFDEPSHDALFAVDGPLVTADSSDFASFAHVVAHARTGALLDAAGSDERRVFDALMRALQRRRGAPSLVVDSKYEPAHVALCGAAPHSGHPFGLIAPRVLDQRTARVWQRWALMSDDGLVSASTLTYCARTRGRIAAQAEATLPTDAHLSFEAAFADDAARGEAMRELVVALKGVSLLVDRALGGTPEGGLGALWFSLGPRVAVPAPKAAKDAPLLTYRVLSARRDGSPLRANGPAFLFLAREPLLQFLLREQLGGDTPRAHHARNGVCVTVQGALVVPAAARAAGEAYAWQLGSSDEASAQARELLDAHSQRRDTFGIYDRTSREAGDGARLCFFSELDTHDALIGAEVRFLPPDGDALAAVAQVDDPAAATAERGVARVGAVGDDTGFLRLTVRGHSEDEGRGARGSSAE